MASIKINEISQSYSYNIGNTKFATVALPITACWGPGYQDPDTLGITESEELESIAWIHFESNQVGMESFVSTYRGPAANYRAAKDYSYQMAMTLLSSGYDIDVCRVCPGTHAQATFTGSGEGAGSLALTAKYPGTFGNTLKVTLTKVTNKNYWNLVVYVVDAAGAQTGVENLVFVLDPAHATDSILHISEIESDFLTFAVSGSLNDSSSFTSSEVTLSNGSDRAAEDTAANMMDDAAALAEARYGSGTGAYVTAIKGAKTSADEATASTIRYNEWLYNAAVAVYDLLTDKLAYSPNRVIAPGWDDQNISEITGEAITSITVVSPIHAALMKVAAASRCATALIDIPKCLPRSGVYSEGSSLGYAQLLSSYSSGTDGLFATHSALFAPWGTYAYVGTSKQNSASPSFLALLIQRAMLANQSLQYEWALPTTRKHNVAVGKLDYTVPKKVLDVWQKSDGVGVNVITTIPDMGTSIWGNSTLYSLPVATYQALWNLSTRYLVNAIEDVIYKAGIAITFAYNNGDAYSKFYAAVTPILDTMQNVGAIDGYAVRMSADINSLDSVNANSVIGKVYIKVNGVINDITVDLVCLPPTAEIGNY